MGRQDVVIEFYYSGAWHAVTAYARDPVVIARGKQNETGGPPTPSTATFTLDNRSGDWSTTNPISALYGLVGLNTPVRITLTDFRFWGEVAAMTPGRTPDFNPATGKGDAWVEVEAAGPLRRYNQGADPLASPLRRALLATNPTAYWPLEDLRDATAGASAVEGVPAMEPYGYSRFQAPGTGTPLPAAGVPEFASGSAIPGSLPVPDWSRGGVLVGRPPVPSAGTQSWRIAFAAVFPRDKQANATTFIGWTVSTGTYPKWEIQAQSTGVFITASDAAGVAGYGTSTATINLFDGQPHFFEVNAQTVAGALDVHVWIDGWDYGTVHTINAANLNFPPGWVETITPNTLEWTAADAPSAGMPQLGHIAVWQPSAPISGHVEGMQGRPGEKTLDRFTRLCAEQGIDSFYSGPNPSDVQKMGIERVATFADQLAEIERTERGVIFEARGAVGLILSTGRGLAGATVAATLDYAAGHLGNPFRPTLDDKGRRNDVTAKSTPTGAEAQRTLDTGPMSTAAPPTGIGRYSSSLDVNPYVVERLGSYARRAVADGTIAGLRFTRIVVDLVANPGLAAAMCSLDPSHRFQVINLPPDITPDTVDLVVLGIVERIGSHTRTIEIIAAPYATVDAPVVDVTRVDSATSVLASAASGAAAVTAVWDFTPTSGLQGWTGLNGSVAISGGALLFTPNGTSASVEARSPNSPATEGTTYSGVWTVTAAVTRSVTPVLIWRNAGGAIVSTSSGPLVTLTAGVPTRVSVAATAPTGVGVTQVMMSLTMGGTPPTSHTLSVDAARLGSDAPLSVSRSGVSNQWTTSGPFPFDVSVGGERCTVTAIAGTGNPQTFTVVRGVNGVVRAWAAGTSVRLWNSPTVGI